MTNPTIASAPRAAGAMKTHPVAACADRPRAPAGGAAASRALVAPSSPERLRWAGLWAAVAVVAIVVCLLAVWALCRAAALGDRIGERLHDARGREEDAR